MMSRIENNRSKDADKELASIEFGLEIARLRELRGFKTQKAFAEVVDIDKSIISDIENGKTNPSLTVIKKLADVLEVNPYSLISIYYGIPIPGFNPKSEEALSVIRDILLHYYNLLIPPPPLPTPQLPASQQEEINRNLAADFKTGTDVADVTPDVNPDINPIPDPDQEPSSPNPTESS